MTRAMTTSDHLATMRRFLAAADARGMALTALYYSGQAGESAEGRAAERAAEAHADYAAARADFVALIEGAGTESHMFVDGEFTAHSGSRLPFKIDCDALTDGDLATLAANVARRHRFSSVYGVPRGGTRFAAALQRYATNAHTIDPMLIVDDVLTTGASMEEAREKMWEQHKVIGVVIFARGPCPGWITPLFTADVRQALAWRPIEIYPRDSEKWGEDELGRIDRRPDAEINASAETIRQEKAEVKRLNVEIAGLRSVIERDRAAIAGVSTEIRKAMASREWLSEGRGSYAYNDDRYQQEFGEALREIAKAAEPLRKIASDWSNCSTDPAAIQEARSQLTQPRSPAASGGDAPERAREIIAGAKFNAFDRLDDLGESLAAAERWATERERDRCAQIVFAYQESGGHEDGSVASLIEAEIRIRAPTEAHEKALAGDDRRLPRKRS